MQLQYPTLERLYKECKVEIPRKDYVRPDKPCNPFPHLDDLMQIQQNMTQEQMDARCDEIYDKSTLYSKRFYKVLESLKYGQTGESFPIRPYSYITFDYMFHNVPPVIHRIDCGIVEMKFLNDATAETYKLELSAESRYDAFVFLDNENAANQAFLVINNGGKARFFELSEFHMLSIMGKGQKNELGILTAYNKEYGLYYVETGVDGHPNLTNAELELYDYEGLIADYK
jgi:hypothetical protein